MHHRKPRKIHCYTPPPAPPPSTPALPELTTGSAAAAVPRSKMGSTIRASPYDRQQRPLLPISASPDSSPPSYSSIVRVRRESERDGLDTSTMSFSSLSGRSQWILLAVASGACAAFNGVFAKLTTTELTTNFALSIANLLGLGDGEKAVEYIIRAMFFALNLIFNGIMWTLFTKALTAGTSTTQVSIINTSANFMVTAVLSFFIFTESLPPLWWLGAALLVAGNVIIGRREEKDTDVLGSDALARERELGRGGEEAEGLLGDAGGEEEIGMDEGIEGGLKRGGVRDDDDDDVLDLGLERVKSEDEDATR